MDWQMMGAVAAVVVPVGGLIVMLVNRQIDAVNRQIDAVNRQIDAVNQKFDQKFDAVDRQFDAVNRQFDVLRAENRAAHAQIGANVDGVRTTLDALLLKLVPAAGRRDEEARR